MLYSLEFITEMFIQLAHATPFLTLQWCYILKLMNHLPQSLWYKVLQPEQRTLSKKSEVQPTNQGKIEMTGGLVTILTRKFSLSIFFQYRVYLAVFF